MRALLPRRSLAIAVALPAACLAGALLVRPDDRALASATAIVRVPVIVTVAASTPAPADAPVCRFDREPVGVIDGNSATGYADVDGDGDLDCWATWNGGGSCCTGADLVVRPSCGDASWQTSTLTDRFEHLNVVAVPRVAGPAAPLALARALWGDLPGDDGALDFLLGDPQPWRHDPVGTSQPAMRILTPDAAVAVHAVARADVGDAEAFLVAHLDGDCSAQPVATCDDGGGSVWSSSEHLAYLDPARGWRWIFATSHDFASIEGVACPGDGIVVVDETDDGVHWIVAIDAHTGARRALRGAVYIDDFGDGDVDLFAAGGHITELSASTLRRMLAAPRRRR